MKQPGIAFCFCILVLTPWLPGQTTADRIGNCRQLVEAREYQKAEAAAKEILSGEPRNAEAGWLLGLSLLGQDRFKEAETALLAAEEALLPPPEPDKAEPAEIQKEAVHSAGSRADDIQIALARAYMGQKSLDQAEAALARAVKIRADNPDLYFYRGTLDAQRKDYAASARDMDKSIELDPKRAQAYYYAGIAYSQIKQPDRMVERFQTFLKLAPDAPEAPKVKALLRSIR